MYFNSKIAKKFLFIFILISLLLVIQSLLEKPSVPIEGFGVKDFEKIIDDIKGVSKVVDDVKDGITSLDDQFAGITNTIRKEATDIVEDKIIGFANEALDAAEILADTAFDKAKGFAEEIGNEVEDKAMGFANEALGSATKMIKQVENTAKKSVDEAKEGVMVAVRGVEIKAKGFADAAENVAKKGIDEAKDGVMEAVRGVEKKAKGFADAAETVAKKGIDEAKEGVMVAVKEVEKNAKKGINEAKEGVMTVVNEVKKIAEEAKDAAKSAQSGITTLGSIIEKKFTSFGGKFVSIMSDAIIDPFTTLFTGLGKVFNQVFGILKEIGNKIVSLPGCVPFYMIDAVSNTIEGISKSILPNFITNFFGLIYDYIFNPIISWFLNLFGYYDSKKKCYGFDVDSQLVEITDEFKRIGTSFTDGFGKFDLGKLSF